MIRRLIGWRKPVETADALPDEVTVAIEGCTVITRPESGQVLVQFRGLNAFRYSVEGAIRYVRDAFPGLSDANVARALRYLDGVVAKRVRVDTAAHASRSATSSRWTEWRPLRIE